MKTLLLILGVIIFSSEYVFAQRVDQDNSNTEKMGSLVVIPKGQTRPVPYEAAAILDTGYYRNFYKLPCVNDNIETRTEFNRSYGCHALPWLEMIKDISPVLHTELIKAATTTHFRIVSNYILWENKPYPKGELDYKKYEKAAYFNGEIILSTPVMDRIGPLSNVLTAEENQGYIIIHELINAAYPTSDVAWKLSLGEIFLQNKIFKQGREESLLRLTMINFRYLEKENNLETIANILQQIADLNKSDDFANFEPIYKYYLLPKDKTLKEAYENYMLNCNIKNKYDLYPCHYNFARSYQKWKRFVSDQNIHFFDINFIKHISSMLKINYYDFYDYDELDNSTPLEIVIEQEIQGETKNIYFTALERYYSDETHLSSLELASQFAQLTSRDQFFDLNRSLEKIFNSYRNQYLSINAAQVAKFSSDSEYERRVEFIRKNKEEIRDFLLNKFKIIFAHRGLDYERTLKLKDWLNGPKSACNDHDYEFYAPLPFDKDDKFFYMPDGNHNIPNDTIFIDDMDYHKKEKTYCIWGKTSKAKTDIHFSCEKLKNSIILLKNNK
ncbi:MAG: hypothetical protein QE271_02380 [Bacteriovoracaceae bacterium]|nr:hypothetical protein [Bacteriovoracaceae bacterium]